MKEELRVWKFPWPTTAGEFTINMPLGSQILCAREQDAHNAVLWAQVGVKGDDVEKWEKRQFVSVTTGGHDNPPGRYVGTAVLLGGGLVLHLFEVKA
jgi:hypothetical protein